MIRKNYVAHYSRMIRLPAETERGYRPRTIAAEAMKRKITYFHSADIPAQAISQY